MPTHNRRAALILGLDLATTTGWALLHPDGRRHSSGTFALGQLDWYRRGWALAKQLDLLLAEARVGLVAYEKVRRHAGGVQAAHVYGSLEADLLRWAHRWGLDVVEVSVGAAKKRLTGRGNADKGAMVRAAERRWTELADPYPLTHDEADALAVALEAACSTDA